LKLFKENNFSSILIYGPLNSGKSILIKGLCRKFLKNFEKTQIMWIPSIENFTGIGLNKKIDDFQLHHFNSDKLTKIIIFENFEFLGNLGQMSMRERMQQQNIRIKFWVITRFYSKINQAINSRCIKIQFTSIYPNAKLIRLVEISCRENIYNSLENLQNSINLDKRGEVISSGTFSILPYITKSCCDKLVYFCINELKRAMYTNNVTREEDFVLNKRMDLYFFFDLLTIKEFFKNYRKQLYYMIPLIDF
jgi:AAA+ ATPase superfamily predicted ATPase